jgi:hypothetical protein
MQPAKCLVYGEPKWCRQHRPVWRDIWFYGRAMLPAPVCFRGQRYFAGCIAPTKNPLSIFRFLEMYVMSRKGRG